MTSNVTREWVSEWRGRLQFATLAASRLRTEFSSVATRTSIRSVAKQDYEKFKVVCFFDYCWFCGAGGGGVGPCGSGVGWTPGGSCCICCGSGTMWGVMVMTKFVFWRVSV